MSKRLLKFNYKGTKTSPKIISVVPIVVSFEQVFLYWNKLCRCSTRVVRCNIEIRPAQNLTFNPPNPPCSPKMGGCNGTMVKQSVKDDYKEQIIKE